MARRSRRRSGPLGAVLTLVAVVAAALTLTLAWSMAFPVPWDGLGKLGSIAMHFSLHLLLASLAALLMVMISSGARAPVAAGIFTVLMFLAIVMAVVPAVVISRAAERLGARVSLRDYVANAAHINYGRPLPDRTVVFGTAGDGSRLELDVWRSGRPDDGPPRPALVLVHGGAWSHGTRSMTPDWDRWFNALGYEVFDVEYRLSPPVRWLDEIGDVKSALGWVAEHAAEYHVDPDRISVMGQSAGANLAMLAAYGMDDSLIPASTPVPVVAVRAVINLYGPCDLEQLYRESPSRNYVQRMLRQYIGGSPDQAPERYAMLSPLGRVSPHAPPTITFLGLEDRIVPRDQATRLEQELTAAGAPHETVLLPASDHGFDFCWGGYGAQIARQRLRAFLDRYDPR